ncbi:MAG: hypothetical protein KatS3mg109_0133 [Pirellulaceae bacterium]|nr:MAG: hypothetical protein KatS3mg109_0133 [Pirellulaceae bacterium]
MSTKAQQDAVRAAVKKLLQSKQAEIPAEQLAAGGAGMPPGAPPMDPAMMGGGMPPGAPPMDPAMMGGPDGAMATEEIPTIEDLASQGDPLAKKLMDIENKLDRLGAAISAIADAAGISVPMSRLFETESRTSPKPKAAEAPEPYDSPTLYDDSADEDDAPEPDDIPTILPSTDDFPRRRVRTGQGLPTAVPNKFANQPEQNRSTVPPATGLTGQPGMPGEGGGVQIRTYLSPKPVGPGDKIVSILRNRKST